MTNHQRYKQAERILAQLRVDPDKHLVRKIAKRARKRSNSTNDRWGAVAVDPQFMASQGLFWMP